MKLAAALKSSKYEMLSNVPVIPLVCWHSTDPISAPQLVVHVKGLGTQSEARETDRGLSFL